MATLGKIRSKGPLIVIVVGAALLAFIAGDTARQIVFSVRSGSATTKFAVIGSRCLSLHSTEA